MSFLFVFVIYYFRTVKSPLCKIAGGDFCFLVYKTKFYFENADLKIWYGWIHRDPTHRKIVIVNKHNNFSIESESIWLEVNSGLRGLHLGLFELFKSSPFEFKNIFDKYGYPYNLELFYQRQIDNINQQLNRYSKNPTLASKVKKNGTIQQLNNLKQIREKELIDIKKNWEIYLKSQGLIE